MYKNNINSCIESLSYSGFASTCFIFIPLNILISLIYNLIYDFKKDTNFYKSKFLKYPIFMNKFLIFDLTYFCNIKELDNELISNSTLISVYIYIIELIMSLLKKLSFKWLMLLQYIFTLISIFLYCSFYCCCEKVRVKKNQEIIKRIRNK